MDTEGIWYFFLSDFVSVAVCAFCFCTSRLTAKICGHAHTRCHLLLQPGQHFVLGRPFFFPLFGDDSSPFRILEFCISRSLTR